MRSLLILPLLVGCAHTPPDVMVQAKRTVDSQWTYVNYASWTNHPYRAERKGNCVAFASAYWAELKRMGENPSLHTYCKLPDGTAHAVLDYMGWRMDVRETWVVKIEESECK
jgi:hypothetical protein